MGYWRARALLILTCALMSALAAPALAQAPDDDALAPELIAPEEEAAAEQEPPTPFHDGVTMRLSASMHGAPGSGQGRPFIYPCVSLRAKSETLYLDLHLPAFVALFDALQYWFINDLLGAPSAFNLFQTLNGQAQLIYVEPVHLRLGQRIWSNGSMRLSGGVALVADVVIFDVIQLGEGLEEGELNSSINSDPLVLGPGGFLALSGVAGPASWELSLEVAYDIYAIEQYEPVSGFALSAESDVQLKITDLFGVFLRPRVTAYTHLASMTYGVALNLGTSLVF